MGHQASSGRRPRAGYGGTAPSPGLVRPATSTVRRRPTPHAVARAGRGRGGRGRAGKGRDLALRPTHALAGRPEDLLRSTLVCSRTAASGAASGPLHRCASPPRPCAPASPLREPCSHYTGRFGRRTPACRPIGISLEPRMGEQLGSKPPQHCSRHWITQGRAMELPQGRHR